MIGTSVVPSAEVCVSLLQSQLAVAVIVSLTVLGTTAEAGTVVSAGAVYEGTSVLLTVVPAVGVKIGSVLSLSDWVSLGTVVVVHGVVVLVLVSLIGVAVVAHSVVCSSVVWCFVTFV